MTPPGAKSNARVGHAACPGVFMSVRLHPAAEYGCFPLAYIVAAGASGTSARRLISVGFGTTFDGQG